jgi:hypothetical protein
MITKAATPEGTKVNWRWDLQFKGIFVVVGAFIATAMKRGSETSLRGLKDLLENQVTPVSS